MTMSMERILWFDEQVRAGRNPRSADLAARFKVSIRTAQRDIEVLRDRLQAPLGHSGNEKGYTYGDAAFDLPSAFFRKEELIGLLYARRLFRDMRPPLREEAEAISARLEDLFRTPLLEKLEETVSFDIGWGPDIPRKIFFDLLRSIIQRRVARLEFFPRGEGGGADRDIEVEPLGLHFSQGAWLLLAHPRRRKGVRIYYMTRIRGIEVTAQQFASAAKAGGGDAAARRTMAVFRGGKARDVRIRFSPEKAEWVSAQAWHRERRLQFGLDGSVVLEMPEARVVEVLGLILHLRGDASVVEPRELRDAVDAEVERLVAAYPARKE